MGLALEPGNRAPHGARFCSSRPLVYQHPSNRTARAQAPAPALLPASCVGLKHRYSLILAFILGRLTAVCLLDLFYLTSARRVKTQPEERCGEERVQLSLQQTSFSRQCGCAQLAGHPGHRDGAPAHQAPGTW